MSMEVFYRPNAQFTIKLEVEDAKELFEELGPLQEIFAECECGKCKCTNIRFVHRNVDKFDYYELQCENCGAKLSLGQDQKSKQLFPRKYEQDPADPKKPLLDHDGKKVWLPSGGWLKWDTNKGVHY